MLQKNQLPAFLLLAVTAIWCPPSLLAAEMSVEDAWKRLPGYEYGQDMAAILAIDRTVTQAMRSAATRSACAQRLAALLTSDQTTLAARQVVCLQLRQIGTAAEVPILAQLLAQPETSQMACYALESIPGRESSAALRAGLTTLEGKRLTGVINSVAARKDPASVPILVTLADSDDQHVGAAALRALANIGDERAAAFIATRAELAGLPTPRDLALLQLRSADTFLRAGKDTRARAIHERLSQPGQIPAIRRAALDRLLRLQGDQAATTIRAWLSEADPQRQRIALGHLSALADEQIDQLITDLSELPAAAQLAVIDLGVARRGHNILPLAERLVESDQRELKLAGIRCLGLVGNAAAIPTLIETLSAGGDLAAAAEKALIHLAPKEAVSALLDALRQRPTVRIPAIRVLVKLNSYDAIDPLIEIASQSDPTQYGPALEGLRGIADPDQTDIPRLVKLLLGTERGKHRDEVEKTILIVCAKLPAATDRSELVLASLADSDSIGTERPEATKYLPLLGRLGGAKALALIESSRASADPAVREASLRALCNWPNAEVADQLLDLATNGPDRTYRRWALRALIRVITLQSDRPEAKTLAMLQNAMKLAEGAAEKELALERGSTIRTMETVRWIGSYLDDPELAQSACLALVELAHHRFLRHPNMDQFDPILEKVGRVSNNPAVVERAKRYRLGL